MTPPPLLFIAADALAGAYLIAHALRRERRDRAGVFVVGLALVGCAVGLSVIELLSRDAPRMPREQQQEPAPRGTSV